MTKNSSTSQHTHYYRTQSAIAQLIIYLTLTTAAITTTAHAQPVGVTGYEAVAFHSGAYRMDEFARVHGDGQSLADAFVWVNGEVIFLHVPDGFDVLIEGDISPTTGIIVGGARKLNGGGQPVVWTINGTTVLTNLPGGTSTVCDATDVTDSGWIIGSCFWPYMAGLWIRENDPINLGGEALWVNNINAHNEMTVGEWYQRRLYLLRQQPTDPFSWDWIEIILPFDKGYLSGLNNNSEIVGELPAIRSAYYWYEGVSTILPEPHPCGYGYDADAINDSGLIVGNGGDSDCGWNYRAAIWERTTPLGEVPPQFNTYTIMDYMPRQPNIKINSATDINSASQIAAQGELETGERVSFLVTPYLLNMSDPVPGIAGQINTITITNLTPHQQVRLVWGTLPGAQPIGNDCLGGLVLIRDAITNPSLTAVADDTGTAIVDIFVPLQTAGKLVRYQAVAPDECNISHTVEFTFQ